MSCRDGPARAGRPAKSTLARDLLVDVINAATNSLHVQEMKWKGAINSRKLAGS